MNELSYVHAIILGAVQGLTEFLPISSSAHLAIAQHLFDLNPASRPMIQFDVGAHVGTVLAIVVVLARQTIGFARRVSREVTTEIQSDRHAWRSIYLAAIAGVPTAVVGLGIRATAESAFAKPGLIGLCLVLTGILLWMTRSVRRGRRGWRNIRWWHALAIGAMQGAAVMPGISRSGATICIALLMGIRRRWAAEFSFFLAVPTILGAATVQLYFARQIDESTIPIHWGPLIAGAVAAFLVGAVALKVLLRAVTAKKLHYFAPYCILLGVLLVLAQI